MEVRILTEKILGILGKWPLYIIIESYYEECGCGYTPSRRVPSEDTVVLFVCWAPCLFRNVVLLSHKFSKDLGLGAEKKETTRILLHGTQWSGAGAWGWEERKTHALLLYGTHTVVVRTSESSTDNLSSIPGCNGCLCRKKYNETHWWNVKLASSESLASGLSSCSRSSH